MQKSQSAENTDFPSDSAKISLLHGSAVDAALCELKSGAKVDDVSGVVEGLELPALPEEFLGFTEGSGARSERESECEHVRGSESSSEGMAGEKSETGTGKENRKGPRLVEHEWRHCVLRLSLPELSGKA